MSDAAGLDDRWWPAPAKLNLFLHVLGRRDDGYHELQTVFQLLDHGDRVRLRRRADDAVERVGELPGVAAGDDLCVRAARLLRRETGCTQGVDIELDKRIPMGGGLGGGSSDAATVLRVLDRLWSLDLGVDRLAALGARLGADVPVFVRGHSAFAGGVGERLQPVRIAPPAWYAVVTPACTVPTGEVFGAPSLTRNTPQSTIRSFLCSGDTAGASDADVPCLDRARLAAQARNDCEPVARRLYPPVAAALDWMAGRGDARLTGTGASVFAAFGSAGEAEAALRGAPPEWKTFTARGVDRSPLLGSPGLD